MKFRKSPQKRAKSITFLALVVLIIAIINLVRMVQVIKQWHFLTTVLSYPPYYLLFTGMIWGICSIYLFFSLWFGWRNTPLLMIGGTILYSIYIWIDRLVFSAAPFDSNWLFILIINGLFLIYIVWTFRRENIKAYFGAAYDERSKDG